MPAFFDSNVILYTAGQDAEKEVIATRCLDEGGWISVQVLNEIANVARRKMHFPWSRTAEYIQTVQNFVDVIDLTIVIHERGRDLAERYQIVVYDAMIVSAAIEAGCDILYSEDMHHGLIVDGSVRIVNPFRSA